MKQILVYDTETDDLTDCRSHKKQRLFWLDCARALAIISVTFNHALSRSFHTREGSDIDFGQMTLAGSFIKAFLYVFSRIGVPLFLMITGALLLRRNYEDRETTKRFLRHNWLELFLTTEIWFAIMFWYIQIFDASVLKSAGLTRALLEFVSTLFFINQTTLPSMWYMPMILMVYLMIPVISIGVRRLGDRFFYVLVLIAAVSGMILPNINTALETMGSSVRLYSSLNTADLFSLYFLYVLAGYWISRKKMDRLNTIWIILGFLVSFLGTTLFQLWIYSTPSGYFILYDDIGILVSGIFLFELFRRYAERLRKFERVITWLSKIAFGIYFLHICIVVGVNSALPKIYPVKRFPEFIILELSSFLLSVLIIWILSANKKIAKVLFLMKE